MNPFIPPLRFLKWAGIFLPVLCSGALQWEAQKIELTAKPAEKELTASFHFTNPDNKPITIETVKPDCGCTTATLSKRTYAPGESGEIKTVFTIGNRVGVYNKRIVVTTDETPAKPIALVMKATIPEIFTCAPRAVFWKRQDALAEKSIVIGPAGELKLSGVEVTGENSAAFSKRVEPMDDGATFRILVQPISTVKVAQATFFCVAKFTDGSSHPFTVSALVR
jgi:Protein of unknown function (DUF1573)